jgi:hypothetical protein
VSAIRASLTAIRVFAPIIESRSLPKKICTGRLKGKTRGVDYIVESTSTLLFVLLHARYGIL